MRSASSSTAPEAGQREGPLLACAPWRFDFFAAVRWIETRARHLPRVGTATRRHEEAVLLGQSPSMSFAAATLSAARPPDGAGPWRLWQRFFGLWGPNGPMPLHLTEQVRERARRRPPDGAWCAFADLFHHRALGLLYRAWSDAEPAVGADRASAGPGLEADDPFGARLAALGGARPPAGARSADAIERAATALLGARVRVRAPVVQWMSVPGDERCRLGSAMPASRLGRGALLGARVRDATSTLRVDVGPVSLSSWRLWLEPARAPVAGASTDPSAHTSAHPSTHPSTRLRQCVRRLVDPCLAIDLRVRLAAADVPEARLSRRDADVPRLGRSAWLSRRAPHDADDLRWRL